MHTVCSYGSRSMTTLAIVLWAFLAIGCTGDEVSTPTSVPSPIPTLAALPSPAIVPTEDHLTRTPTQTPTPTPTSPPTPTSMPTPTPTPTPTRIPVPTPSLIQAPTPTPTPTATPTPTPTPSPTPAAVAAQLYGVDFVRAGEFGWVVGERGVIFNTTDYGETWTQQDSGTTDRLNDVDFVTTTTGWAVGNTARGTGFILKTTDGGATWTVSATFDKRTDTLSFWSTSKGWVTAGSAIYATTDGGETWESQGSWAQGVITDIVFFSPGNTAFLASTGGAQIRKSTNGGTIWLPINTLNCCPNRAIAFVSASLGWIGGTSYLCWTDDGGDSWNRNLAESLHEWISSMTGLSVVDDQTGWAVGGNGWLVKTANRGFAWSGQLLKYTP